MIMDNAYRNINVIVTVWCELKIRSLTRAAQIFLLPLAVARASLCIHTHLLRYRYARASLLNLYTRGSDFFYYRLLSRMLLCVFIRTCSAIASRVLLCLIYTRGSLLIYNHVCTMVSGFNEILSIPCCTSHFAKSG